MLYSEVLKLWINYKEPEIRNSTRKIYSYAISKWINPKLGHIPISDINRNMIQEYIVNASKVYRRETVINITKVLSQSLKFATRNSYIPRNPYTDIKIPKDKEYKEIQVFMEEEIDKILSIKGFSLQKNMVNLAFRTGMRIGEILTLKWEDINIESGFLTVRRTLSTYTNGKAEICPPKTKYSKRRIDLDIKTLKMLENIEKKGDFIFCKNDKTIFSRQYINQVFRKMCKNAGVPYRCFHSLRHTHATILLAANVNPKVVQIRLGHSTISTTLDIYSHLIPGMQNIAVNVFNKLDGKMKG